MNKFFIFILPLTFLSAVVFAQPKNQVKAKHIPIDTEKFILVEGGTFKMGTAKPVEPQEGPGHTVMVKSFYLSKTETTFEDYDRFCLATKRDTTGTSSGWGRSKQPAMNLSWLDAVSYCNWLSKKENISKYYNIQGADVSIVDSAKGYRLPTEAEWEFAARGGNKSKGTLYAGSEAINNVAWFVGNSGGKTHPVAQKAPNELGLFDMNGNIWEWVWDWYGGSYYRSSSEVDPRGPAIGNYRVMRGGAFYNFGNYATVYTRQNSYISFRQNSVGFRVARTYFK